MLPSLEPGRLQQAISGTPVFVVDRAVLEHRFGRLRAALDAHWPESAIGLSYKTNYAVARLRPLPDALAEVVSQRELDLARALGVPAERTILNGPNKGPLHQALAEGVTVHLDHSAEIGALEADPPPPCAVGLRLRHSPAGRPESRFGFPPDQALDAARRLRALPGVTPKALSVHGGTDVDAVADHAAGARLLGRFACTLRAELGLSVESVDTGGGFPGRLRPWRRGRWEPAEIDVYIAAIAEALRETLPPGNPPLLIVEPGRYLVDDAVVLLSRVLEAGPGQALVDATCAMLPMVAYRPLAPRALGPDLHPLRSTRGHLRLYGASCVEDDLLFEGNLPALRPGDHVAFYSVGAYNQSMAGSFIYEAPPTVLL